MSTTITDVYNNFVTVIETALPSHKRLHNPYSVEENPEMIVRKGWGLQIDDGINSNRCISPEYYLQRNFSVVITRENVAKDSDPVRRDAAKLELLEDLHLLISASVLDNTLTQVAARFQYESDTGLQEVYIQDKPYSFIQAQFLVEYSQQITGA